MRVRLLQIHADYLVEMFTTGRAWAGHEVMSGLPDGCRLTNSFVYANRLFLEIAHDSFDEVAEGESIPEQHAPWLEHWGPE